MCPLLLRYTIQALTTHEKPSMPTDAIKLVIAVIRTGNAEANVKSSSVRIKNGMQKTNNKEIIVPSFANRLIQSATSVLSSSVFF